jgi:hypothetical protein
MIDCSCCRLCASSYGLFSCLCNNSGKALAGKVLEQQKRIADLQRKLSAAEKAEGTTQTAPLSTKSSKVTSAAAGGKN